MLLAVLLAVLALATGCRGSADPPDPGRAAPEPDRAAIRAGLARSFAGDHPAAEDVHAGDCFARHFTEQVTPQELRDAGVVDSSYAVVPDLPRLPEDLATRWVDAQFRCTDFVAESARAQDQIAHGAIDTAAWSSCLRAGLSDEELRAAVVDTLTGSWDGAALGRLSAAQAACGRAQD